MWVSKEVTAVSLAVKAAVAVGQRQRKMSETLKSGEDISSSVSFK